MDTYQLGSVIKKKRKSLRLTQEQVVGDFITRNMLSQIESGSANPSLKTLRYLADKLDITFAELFGGAPGAERYFKAKTYFGDAEYNEVLAVADNCRPENGFYDEILALASLSAIELAESMYMQRKGTECAEFCDRARKYASSGIFRRSDLAEKADGIKKLLSSAEKVKTA
jgi:transcriptional regulator with XRE-family HTH domain